jgi:all-trans-retinol 13,14-reductase
MIPRKAGAIITAVVIFFSCNSHNVKEAESNQKIYDVIVIGAGGGGLGAAARCTLKGMRVLVIEQHDKVGGYMTAFRRGPYTFEVSLHAFDGLNESGLNRRVFNELGIINRVKPVRLDPMYRSYFPDAYYDTPADPDKYMAMLINKFPSEKKGIEGLFAALNRINAAMESAMYFKRGHAGKGIWNGFKNTGSFFTIARYWNSSLDGLLKKYIKDERLKTLFTQLSGFLGAEPERISGMVFAMMWNSYHRGGYYYFEGGSQSVSNALAEVIKENGGEILLSTLAVKILIKDGAVTGVQTGDGKVYRCRYVISNANAPDTLFKLAGKNHFPSRYVEKVEKMKIACSSFQVYMGVRKDFRALFASGTHELMINAAEKQSENYKYIHEGDIERMPFAIANYSMVDPACSPAGKNVICITAIMPYDWNNGWQEKDDYARYTALKKRVAGVLIKRAEKYLPGLGDCIEEMEVGSPRTMEHYTLNPLGSIIGWENTPGQSMLKRLPQKTPVKNLFLAGAWTFPCGGQSAVLLSGIFAADMVLSER